MLCNPNNDVMIEPGDTLLFMAKSEEERDLEIFLPGRFALHDPNRKEEFDDRQAALLAEAEELFKQGVLLSRKQDGAQEAYQLFHEAAIKGFSRAKYNLGILNFHGKGVPRNVDEATTGSKKPRLKATSLQEKPWIPSKPFVKVRNSSKTRRKN